MPRAPVHQDQDLVVSYTVPRRGLVEFRVYAEAPVTTFVVDDAGLEDLANGEEEVPSYGGFHRRRIHHQELRLPFRGAWHLVIRNDGPATIEVEYEVRY